MSTDGRRRRGLTYEDRVLWTHVARSIKPLRAEAKNVAGEVEDVATPPVKQPPKPPSKFKKLASTAPVMPVPSPAKPAAPALEPLTRRMKQRVAKGRHEIDARLDLHGFTQDEAHAVLLRFLRAAQGRGARLVLVITGKGRGGETGVLKRSVPHWLRTPEFAHMIIGFEDAAISHGGEGALYVRVRRTSGA